MLLIDGVRYELWTPPSEDEFERLVGDHAEEIFGKDAKYFDLKHKIASRFGTGSIPDGYVISLGDKPEVQIIEMELASHSLNHIVSQMVNIINGIENPSTQQKICSAIEDGINEDNIFAAKVANAIKPKSILRFLSDNFSDTLPILNIIIDESLPKMEEAVHKISAASRIVEFRTFRRIGAEAVHAHLFEPVGQRASGKTVAVTQPGNGRISVKLARIEDEGVRDLCRRALEEMGQQGIEIRPTHDEWMSCWFKNRQFLYMGCKKRFFVAEVKQSDGHFSSRIRVSTQKEWDDLLNNQIRIARQRIEQ